MTVKTIYIKQLTFLRFLAASMVVVFHFGKETWPFNSSVISSLVNEGSIAVSFFFFLSGAVLALNYLGKDNFNVKHFLIKRFARIYPVYILAFLAALLLGIILNNSYPKGGSIILQALSLHAWFPGKSLEINFPSWSIAVEVFFYLLFPFILMLLKRLGNSKAIIFIILFWIVSAVQHYIFSTHLFVPDNAKVAQFILYFPLWHLNTFLMGILCAKYILFKTQKNQTDYLVSRLFYLIGIAGFLVILGTNNFIKPFTHNGLMAPFFFMIVAGIATDKSLLTKFLGNKFFILLGDSSYALYLLQWPVFMCYSYFIGVEKLAGIFFYGYLVTLIIISCFVYIGIEKKLKAIISANLS